MWKRRAYPLSLIHIYNPALTAALNKALQELKDDGTIQGILDKYIKAE